MRTGSVFPLAAVVLLVAHHASAAPSVPEALKRVQTARENLAKAVKQIEKDPPSAADLDVAHAAVGALKAAIDAGGELEANDLEYAKAVLSARKELRTQREYVDARRANIKVHEARRAIDASLAALGESVKRLDAKEPSPQDLDGARAAAQAVRKQATEAQPFAKHDPKFATYLSEVDATVGRHEQKVDDRWVQLSAAKHRAQVAETRKRLSASLAAASKEMSSEKFDAASKELTTLEKQLVEGKPLEAKDKGYKPEADRARVEVAEAKKRMEALVSQASVDKLKGEIEPAHEQLIGSRKLLRSGPVTEEQLAEAKTAITVVKKLVEKFQSQAERSKPFGTYLEGVKKNLAETEVALQRRSLDGAKRNVVQALRQVERRNATDESFQETKTALTVLEKTLEPINAKDPELAAHVGDARQLIKDANITLTRRRSEVDILRHRAKIDEARKAASEKVRQLYAATPSAPEVAETEASVKAVQTLLEEGAPFAKKDGDYKAHAKETQDRIADLNGRIASRKIQLAATDGRSKVSEALGEAEPKVETARGAESTDAQIEQAAKSVDAVGLALDSRA
ncbi:MAG TPA: hypothetical protein VEY30_03135, partial [Myxococcaceae bacterium]|nr:hypothetical protein [Myxococcaceae bacterium]